LTAAADAPLEGMTSTPKIWHATVADAVPGDVPGPLGVSLAGKALALGLWAWRRGTSGTSATDRHRSVDDTRPAAAPAGAARDVLAALIDAADVSRIAKRRPRC